MASAATQNSANQRYTNNTDGFSLGGGTTPRTLTVTGGDVTITGAGSNTYTYPGNSTTLVGVDSTQTLTNKTWNGSTIGVPYGGTGAATLTGLLEGNGTSAVTAVTGTANYAARWTSTNAIGTGVLYDDGTNVGIGTTTPVGGLSVMNGNVGIGTWVPANALDVKGSSVFDEYSVSSGTSITIDWTNGNNQYVNISTTSAVTISMSNGVAGENMSLITCNDGVTGGGITFSGAKFSGGTQPGSTTTSGECDDWFFHATKAGSGSIEYWLTGMTPGITY